MPNIEIKAVYPDLEKAKTIAISLGAKLLWDDHQRDTYFFTQSGKLKLRGSGLNGAELLPYVKIDDGTSKRSDYARIPVSDPALTRELLSKLLGEKLSVSKRRIVYLLDNVRIHLDQVEDLGSFLEFEAVFNDDTSSAVEREKARVREVMKAFEIADFTCLDGSYPDLLNRKTGANRFEEIYRSHADEYDELVRCEDFEGNLPRALTPFLNADLSVIELGAGTGRLTRMIVPQVKEILACDASAPMLSVAEKQLSGEYPRPSWRLAVAEHRQLPAFNASADLVVAGWTLGHFTDDPAKDCEADIRAALTEMDRVLKPGGQIVVIETLGTGDVDPSPPNDRLAAYYALLERDFGFTRSWIRTDYRFSTIEQGERLIRFFFGSERAERFKKANEATFPECTGIWIRKKDHLR